MTQLQRYVYIYRPLRVIWALSSAQKNQSPDSSNQSPFSFFNNTDFKAGWTEDFYDGWQDSWTGPDMVAYFETESLADAFTVSYNV